MAVVLLGGLGVALKDRAYEEALGLKAGPESEPVSAFWLSLVPIVASAIVSILVLAGIAIVLAKLLHPLPPSQIPD